MQEIEFLVQSKKGNKIKKSKKVLTYVDYDVNIDFAVADKRGMNDWKVRVFLI